MIWFRFETWFLLIESTSFFFIRMKSMKRRALHFPSPVISVINKAFNDYLEQPLTTLNIKLTFYVQVECF